MDDGKAGNCDKKHISFTACKNVGSELYSGNCDKKHISFTACKNVGSELY
jgi:hypothetical protein